MSKVKAKVRFFTYGQSAGRAVVQMHYGTKYTTLLSFINVQDILRLFFLFLYRSHFIILFYYLQLFIWKTYCFCSAMQMMLINLSLIQVI